MRSAVTQLQNTKEVGKRHCSTRASVWKSRCSGQNVPALDGSWPAQCHASFHVQKCSVMVTSSPPCMFRSPTSKWPSTCKACKVHNADFSSAKRCGWPSGLAVKCAVPIASTAPLPRSCTGAPPTSDGATQVPGGTPTCAACEWWQSLAACKHRRLRHWHSLVPWPWQLRTHDCEQSATNLQRTTAWLPVSTNITLAKYVLETFVWVLHLHVQRPKSHTHLCAADICIEICTRLCQILLLHFDIHGRHLHTNTTVSIVHITFVCQPPILLTASTPHKLTIVCHEQLLLGNWNLAQVPLVIQAARVQFVQQCDLLGKGVGNWSSTTGSRRQSNKKTILKHFLKGSVKGKVLAPKWRKSVDKSLSQPWCSHSHTSSHLRSCELFSPHLTSSQLFSSHPVASHMSSKKVLLNCFHLIRALINLSHLLEFVLNSSQLFCTPESSYCQHTETWDTDACMGLYNFVWDIRHSSLHCGGISWTLGWVWRGGSSDSGSGLSQWLFSRSYFSCRRWLQTPWGGTNFHHMQSDRWQDSQQVTSTVKSTLLWRVLRSQALSGDSDTSSLLLIDHGCCSWHSFETARRWNT